MAKRIDLQVPGVRLNETGYRFLGFIAERARVATGLACEPVQIGRKEFRSLLDMTDTSIIRACHALESNGLIEIKPCRDENGAQVMNSYALTALGIEVLRIADKAVAEGRVGVS